MIWRMYQAKWRILDALQRKAINVSQIVTKRPDEWIKYDMDIKVLLCKEEKKWIVTFKLRDDVRHLRKLAGDIFNLAESSVILQYYDNEFIIKEWIDAEEDFKPSDKKFEVITEMNEVSLGKWNVRYYTYMC